MDKAGTVGRKILFSVTADDCDFDTFTAGGNGGQNQNRVRSAVRCTHRASSAVGTARDTRDQHRNKRLAFKRMAETKEFLSWHRVEVAKKTGEYVRMLRKVEQAVEEQLNEKYLRIETFFI